MALIKRPNLPPKVEPSAVSATGSASDMDALAIVKKDVDAAQAYMAEKSWVLRWREIDSLYQSPRPISMWEGTTTPESNVTSFIVAKHTNSLVPAVMNGIFFQEPFFKLRPTPSMMEETIRQKETIFSEQFREMEFEQACEDGWFYTVLFGTGIYKRAECIKKETRKTYRKRGKSATVPGAFSHVRLKTEDSKQIDVHEEDEENWNFEFYHIRNECVLVDPTLSVSDIRKAKFVVHVEDMTGYELIELAKEHEDDAKEEGWQMPSEATIRSWFETPAEPVEAPGQPEAQMAKSSVVTHAEDRFKEVSGDPLMKPMKVWEHWTKDQVRLVINDKYVARNAANKYGKIPFYSSHWWRIPNSFWSLGVGHVTGQEQRVDQGARNAMLNILSMSVNPMILRTEGDNQPGQNIRLRRGGIITVHGDDVRKGFGLLEMPQVPPALWQALANTQSNAEGNSGADQTLMQGNTSGPRSSILRTAGGAAEAAGASANRIQGPVTRFVNNVLLPVIYDLDESINEEMSEDQMERILGDELGKEYMKNFDVEKYLNGRSKFEVLATQHLAAKRGMAQMLPVISQIFEGQLLQQLHQIGWTIDPLELVMMYMEVSEFTNRYNLVRRLTPQEKQQMMQMQQAGAMAKTQGQMAIDNNNAKNQDALQAGKNDAQAEQIVLRKAMEHAMLPEVLGGGAGGDYASEEGVQ